MATFRPLCINALYTGSSRGLAADLAASNELGSAPRAVCTSLVTASHGHVTDVLPVPADTVEAQLEHLFTAVPAAERPTAVRIGIVGQAATVEGLFRHLQRAEDLYVLLDLTLSGPAGEDLIDAAGLDAFKEHLGQAEVTTLRRTDAELVAGMEIGSLDDAQVAVQRIHRLGAKRVVLRCGELPARHFDGNGDTTPYFSDLYYDGDDFHLFEAPHLDYSGRGASSRFTLALLRALGGGSTTVEAVQQAKRYVTDWLREQVQQQRVENTQSL